MTDDVTLRDGVVVVGERRLGLPHPADDAFVLNDLLIVPYAPSSESGKVGQFNNLVALGESGEPVWIAELPNQWWTAVNSSGAKEIASKVDVLASKDQIGGTPTVFVGRAGGTLHNVLTPQQQRLNDAPNLQITEQALNTALAGA